MVVLVNGTPNADTISITLTDSGYTVNVNGMGYSYAGGQCPLDPGLWLWPAMTGSPSTGQTTSARSRPERAMTRSGRLGR